jgi:NodT family efflux transporter outer membrane factor (OMF) lipoprotein
MNYAKPTKRNRRSSTIGITRTATYSVCVAALLAAGCMVGPDYHTPPTPTMKGWGELTTAPTSGPATRASTASPVVRWWTTFQDPTLDALVDRAVQSNRDLRRARARVVEARAQRKVVGADLFPTANVSGGYTHSRFPSDAFGTVSGGATSTGGTTGTTGGTTGTTGGTAAGASSGFGAFPGEQDIYQAGFDASWEIDVFGGVRRSLEAATADLAAAIDDQRDVLVTLLGDVARNYVDLRGFQRQIAIARENLQTQRETLDLTRTRLAGGLASDLDVARAEAQVATTGSQIPTLEASARQSIHKLGVLLGVNPMALSEELSPPQPIPQTPPLIPVGMPSDLLRRRPDIRRAERQLAAATARVGVATADLFPKFSLTGSLGLESSKSQNLLNYSSRFYSIGPSVSWPIFDAGRIRANIRVLDAREEQAVAAYEQSVLVALQEVEDALVAYNKEGTRRQTLETAADANRRAVDLANQLYAAGRTDFLSVLEAQRDLYASQDSLVQSDRLVSTNLVTLYKVLGGGWQTDAPTTQPMP